MKNPTQERFTAHIYWQEQEFGTTIWRCAMRYDDVDGGWYYVLAAGKPVCMGKITMEDGGPAPFPHKHYLPESVVNLGADEQGLHVVVLRGQLVDGDLPSQAGVECVEVVAAAAVMVQNESEQDKANRHRLN